MTVTETKNTKLSDDKYERPTVNGPAVKKLLTQPLKVGETLQLSRGYSHDLDLVERVGLNGGRDSMLSHRKAFRVYNSKLGRSKTCAELAVEIDAWLLARADEEAAERAKQKAGLEEQARKTAARKALVSQAESAGLVVSSGAIQVVLHAREGQPALSLNVRPNNDGTGWAVDWFTSQTINKGLSTDELRDLLVKLG